MAKIRQGFVSNSSSSSFIVVFNQPELSVEFLRSVLYHNADAVPYEYNWGNECVSFDTDMLCSAIVNEMKPLTTDDEWIELFGNMTCYDDCSFPAFPDYVKDGDERERNWARYNEAHAMATQEAIAAFKATVPSGQHVFVGEFSDNDGQMFTQLEHGGTFDSVQHQRISHH